MATQITTEQNDWLTRFLGRNMPQVTPEMAVNTAGGAVPEPGLLDRFDAAVNGAGAAIFGSAGRMPAPSAAPAPAAPASAAAEAPEPGIMERMDMAVNALGASIFGSAGQMPAASDARAPKPEAQAPSASAPDAAPEPGIMERFDNAVNDLGAAIFGSAGRMD